MFFSRRLLWVAMLTFFLSILISAFFQLTRAVMVFWVSVAVLVIVVLVGIITDIIGTATTAAQEKPFHAMATDRVFGAKKALFMVRRADKVASFCNDVIGDICGTVSGAISSALVFDLVTKYELFQVENAVSMIVVGLVAAVTVGGKAWGKTIAINRANYIVLQTAKFLTKVEGMLGLGENNKRKKAGK